MRRHINNPILIFHFTDHTFLDFWEK